MNDDELRALLETNAAELRRLKEALASASDRSLGDAEGEAACRAAAAEFWRRYDALSFPGGYETGALQRISAGDAATIETALVFVESHPYFFRSGYMRQALIRRLKRAVPGTKYEARFAAFLEKERARPKRRRR